MIFIAPSACHSPMSPAMKSKSPSHFNATIKHQQNFLRRPVVTSSQEDKTLGIKRQLYG